MRRGAVERERDLSPDVDAGIVVVAGLGNLRAVSDEDDFAADLAGERASVGDPFASGVEPTRRGTEQVQAARRSGARRRLEDERLQERSLVTAGAEAGGGQPVGDLLRGAVSPWRARPPAFHLGRGQGSHPFG